jgi:hypothetical protein
MHLHVYADIAVQSRLSDPEMTQKPITATFPPVNLTPEQAAKRKRKAEQEAEERKSKEAKVETAKKERHTAFLRNWFSRTVDTAEGEVKRDRHWLVYEGPARPQSTSDVDVVVLVSRL